MRCCRFVCTVMIIDRLTSADVSMMQHLLTAALLLALDAQVGPGLMKIRFVGQTTVYSAAAFGAGNSGAAPRV